VTKSSYPAATIGGGSQPEEGALDDPWRQSAPATTAPLAICQLIIFRGLERIIYLPSSAGLHRIPSENQPAVIDECVKGRESLPVGLQPVGSRLLQQPLAIPDELPLELLVLVVWLVCYLADEPVQSGSLFVGILGRSSGGRDRGRLIGLSRSARSASDGRLWLPPSGPSFRHGRSAIRVRRCFLSGQSYQPHLQDAFQQMSRWVRGVAIPVALPASS
jgi:hypothetical protein